jgi:hypothetical protein
MLLKLSLSSPRVRRAKVALIERIVAFGALETPKRFNSLSQIKQFFRALDQGTIEVPQLIDDAATMPSLESERMTEAMRRALPQLVKLERYERHAVRLRDRSLRAILESKNCCL